jgi:hypothetical protein
MERDMAQQKVTDSICSLSWINKKTGLPENDGDGPPFVISGHSITREDDALPFRFLNLLEASIFVAGSPPRVLSCEFSNASKIYQNPSFGGIKSEAFETKQSVTKFGDRAVFQQIAGARTVSPETIAEGAGSFIGGLISPAGAPVGQKVGRAVAHEYFGFPPIWTILQLTLYADGRSSGSILCHSLFPSMNVYVRVGGTFGLPRITAAYQSMGSGYDAVPHLEEWKAQGWGALPANPSGPCQGNPWGLKKTDLTVRPKDAAMTRVV